MNKTKVKVVIGSNYGDEGKGMATCYFSQDAAGKCLNVLYNGGCQRGHTVELPDGTRHVFHHLGSGTLAGADTYFDYGFIMNPIFFVQEWEELHPDTKCYISPYCRVSTPYDAFINQIVELSRGKDRHGSCGMGIWETRKRYESGVLSLKYADLVSLSDKDIMLHLRCISRHYLTNRLKEYGINNIPDEYYDLINSYDLAKHYLMDLRKMQSVVEIREFEDIADRYDTIVFEGAQGLALDEDNADEYPNVTASKTGPQKPLSMVNDMDCEVEICYVTRSYFTRHGAGKFPTCCNKNEINPDIEDNTNIPNAFQGEIRYGHFDENAFYSRTHSDMASTWLHYTCPITYSMLVTHMNYADDQFKKVTLAKESERFKHVYLSFSKYPNEIRKVK